MKHLPVVIIILMNCAPLSAQVKVTFTITDLPKNTKAPKDIFIAGSFNMWNPGSKDWQLNNNNSAYSATYILAPGNYEYKFTRGSWLTSECGIKGADVQNRTLHLTHDTTVNVRIAEWRDNYPVELARKHTASKNVQLISAAFDMPQLNRKRRIWIYLPTDYQASQKKYPVIYMQDGQNLFDEFTAGFGEWGIDEFLDSLNASQPKFIVVGIDNGEKLRMAEYSPYDSEYAKAEGDQYVRFLVETLKPYIDLHYKTLSDAKHTTIAGSSMGGLISMYATLKYPQVFGNAGIFSPAFWINKPIYDLAQTTALKTSRFYFVCGDKESDQEVSDMTKMVAILTNKGLPAKNIPVTIIKDAKHNEAQWKADLPAFYNWLINAL